MARPNISINQDATFSITYGQCVDLGYCRPVVFHRHEGLFSISLSGGKKAFVSSKKAANLTGPIKDIPALTQALEFKKLVMTPMYESDGLTPKINGYQGSMIDWGKQKLDLLRQSEMPNAAGIIIAPTIEMADFMAEIIEIREGKRPTVVHTRVKNAHSKIRAFRNSNHRWIVSVGMISEGVDIPRARILIYLPPAFTEIFFRQGVGRVIRNFGPNDLTRAYVIMPAFKTLDLYARRIEDQMPSSFKLNNKSPSQRVCPKCMNIEPINATQCSSCGFQFPINPLNNTKTCNQCNSINPINASKCQNCGGSFTPKFNLTLKDAMRTGAITRGVDLDEKSVQQAEAIAPEIKKLLLNSGDAKLIEVLGKIPEEMMPRLANVLAPALKKRGLI